MAVATDAVVVPAEALDALPDAVVLLDRDGSVARVNAAAEVLWRRPAADIRGRRFETLVEAESARAWAADAPSRPAALVVVLRRGDGTSCPAAAWTLPARTAAGDAARLVVLRATGSAAAPAGDDDPARLRLMALLYGALAETRRILRAREADPPEVVLTELAERLAELLAAHLVYVGVLDPGATWVRVVAAGGAARSYVEDLRVTDDAGRAEGRGPAGEALRRLGTVHSDVLHPDFAPWRARAEAFGLGGTWAAAAPLPDGRRALFALYHGVETVPVGLEDLFVQLAREVADFLVRHDAARRLARLEQYREAHRAMQERFFAGADATDVLGAMADTLVRSTDAQAVDVLVPDADGRRLRRLCVAGPLAAFMEELPTPALDVPATPGEVPLPTRVWHARRPLLVRHPARDAAMPGRWRESPLDAMGAVAGWPIPHPRRPEPVGVVTIVGRDPETFTPEVSELVTAITRSAAMALAQIEDRQEIARLSRFQQAALAAQQAFLAAADPPALYARLVDLLVREAGAFGAYVAVPRGGGPRLEVVAAAAREPDLEYALRRLKPSARADRRPWGQLFCSQAYRERRPVGPADPAAHAPVRRLLASLPALAGLRAVMAWPVPVADDAPPEAVVAVLADDPHYFAPGLLGLLGQLVESLRLALVRLKASAEIARLAQCDPLTGLANRRGLDDILEQALARARRHGSRVAVCMLDLDDFKAVNDHYGHEGGDRVLQEVARRLEGAVRKSDGVARLGGDEFVLVLEDLKAPEDVDAALGKVVRAVSAPCPVGDGRTVDVRASIGAALFPDDGERPQDLLRRADRALYVTKARKGGRRRDWFRLGASRGSRSDRPARGPSA
ncbi:MAG: diguanylate cyclase [Actinomycetia bacterium]|nr:diguanylate cyclase [Actinomycetes bacterium]